ncbi:Thioredoxin-like 4A [Friedmanniomyces endolithicus]|nr:Thioredoxin-like 4A [Friedmanniomyces endolithicus]KAK0980781.1 Thioredoxin-like 4A [Friedmanniomyces endolithicus]KAK1044281.1 Thioredoxin-like 4A [Friedmanniomyces endolithicus]
MGSVVIPHLVTGWHVDQAIMSEEDRLVVIRFGRDWDPDCMRQDEVLYKIADRVKNFAVIYVCDIDQVPDFKQMYELYDTVTLMFFFRNKHMMCDFGTGNNNKLNWVLEDKQELIDIVETIYKGAKKGRGLVISVLSGRDECRWWVVSISGPVGTPPLRICQARADRMGEHIIGHRGESARDDEAMKAFRVTEGVYGWSSSSYAMPYKV